MTVYRTTSFSEFSTRDTDNRDPIAGRTPADELYPILGVNGTFKGTLANQWKYSGNDHDYFVIDVKDGVNDWSGSVAPGTTLFFTVQGDIDIQWRLVDYTYLNTYGPYGKWTFYRTSVDHGFNYLSLSDQLPKGSALAFQILSFNSNGSYSIDVKSNQIQKSWKKYLGVGNRNEGFKLFAETEQVSLDGKDGNDLLWGGRNADEIYGGKGRDILIGDRGRDKLYGQAGADQLLGGSDADEAYGGDGNDYINGEWGNDRLNGEAGHDLIYGGFGRDRISGGTGNDTIYGGSSKVLKGGYFGSPILINWNGANGQQANPEFWTIAGEAQDTDKSADYLYGNEGRDTLYGQAGNDRLNGGPGADRLWGGKGADVFEFTSVSDSTATGFDKIYDFEQGRDKIALDLIDANVHQPGDQIFIFLGLKPYSGFAGELRSDGTTVEADVDGDRQSDIVMVIRNTKGLNANDFYL